MARMLRLKADLQEVAISAEYKAQKWTLTKKEKEAAAAEGEDEEEEEDDGEDPIKKILFDETGFLKPLVEALKVPSHALINQSRINPLVSIVSILLMWT